MNSPQPPSVVSARVQHTHDRVWHISPEEASALANKLEESGVSMRWGSAKRQTRIGKQGWRPGVRDITRDIMEPCFVDEVTRINRYLRGEDNPVLLVSSTPAAPLIFGAAPVWIRPGLADERIDVPDSVLQSNDSLSKTLVTTVPRSTGGSGPPVDAAEDKRREKMQREDLKNPVSK